MPVEHSADTVYPRSIGVANRRHEAGLWCGADATMGDYAASGLRRRLRSTPWGLDLPSEGALDQVASHDRVEQSGAHVVRRHPLTLNGAGYFIDRHDTAQRFSHRCRRNNAPATPRAGDSGDREAGQASVGRPPRPIS